jgi:hypothetical protein
MAARSSAAAFSGLKPLRGPLIARSGKGPHSLYYPRRPVVDLDPPVVVGLVGTPVVRVRRGASRTSYWWAALLCAPRLDDCPPDSLTRRRQPPRLRSPPGGCAPRRVRPRAAPSPRVGFARRPQNGPARTPHGHRRRLRRATAPQRACHNSLALRVFQYSSLDGGAALRHSPGPATLNVFICPFALHLSYQQIHATRSRISARRQSLAQA